MKTELSALPNWNPRVVPPKRTKIWMWAALILCALAVFQTWRVSDAKWKLANQEARDSIYFKDARALYISHLKIEDSLQSLLNKSEGLRATEQAFHEQRENVLIADNKRMRRKLADVNTETATTAQLDSIHLALYGPAPDDSTHLISMEHSRQLTGDALRLPIVESMLTNTEAQLDEWKGHYTRMEGSYKVDLETAGQIIDSAQETNDGLMKTVEKMQGVITEQDRKFRRARRKERIVEGLIVVGVVILSL